MTALFIILAFVAGAAACWLMLHGQTNTMLTNQASTHEQHTADLKAQHAQQVAELKGQHAQQTTELKAQFAKQTELQHAQWQQQAEQQRRQAEQQLQLIREQMNATSERILKARAEELSANNQEELSKILTPLQTGIQQMRDAVERNSKQTGETMVRLDTTIRDSMALSREVGVRADALAKALTSENKTQGNFGELRLKQLLQDMGLEEGVQFEEQVTLRDEDGRTVHDEEDGRRKQPDVVLHFPDQRDVIIDSKMSLTAFERYHLAQDDDERALALKQHVASMRSHVRELASKSYAKSIRRDRGTLDFVLMYVFSESALQLALQADPTLWREAYDQGVIISGSQNLYMMLRVLEMTWKQVRQIENQQRIIDCANTIIDRVQLFAERFEEVKTQFQRTQKALDGVERITAQQGQSIVTPARQLIKMGGKENVKRKSLENHVEQEL